MRIDSYPPPYAMPLPAGVPRASTPLEPPEALSAHDRLQQAIEEKRSLVATALPPMSSVPELGQHIDLRV